MTAKNIRKGHLDYTNSEFISEEEYKARQSRGTSHKGDILFTTEAPMGNVALADLDIFSAGQRVITLQKYNHTEWINNKFYYYYILSDFFQRELQKQKTGSTVEGIKAERLMRFPIPVPPFAEQLRIVQQIESLFHKLDEAKEKAQAVVDGFELRKSAILHKAFTGELTEQWRQAYGKRESFWRTVRFDQVAEIKSNLVNPIDYQEFPHIAPDNIEKRTGILLKYRTIAEDCVKSGKHRFYAGQILYSKIRPYLSKVVIVDFDGLCSADMYPIYAKENSRYLWYYMLSDEFLVQASNAGSRSVLPKINQKELSGIMVQMTSIDEQEAIVKILDVFFEKERRTREAIQSVLDQIDTMKKSILTRAFRGKLGTNDPTEESAIELLKRGENNLE